MGGNMELGDFVDGHPFQAMFGESRVTNALDGKPYEALHGGGSKGVSGAAPVSAPAVGGAATVPSMGNFSPPTVNNNNIAPPLGMRAGPAATPLGQAGGSPQPMASIPPANAPAPNGSMPAGGNNNFGMAMQQIQHPQFQNFVGDIMKNIGTSNPQPAA